MKRVVSIVLLHIAYCVGIGPMALFFRAVGKKILSDETAQSTWSPISGSDDPKRMY